jgi:hypothetical protein
MMAMTKMQLSANVFSPLPPWSRRIHKKEHMHLLRGMQARTQALLRLIAKTEILTNANASRSRHQIVCGSSSHIGSFFAHIALHFNNLVPLHSGYNDASIQQ